MSDDSILYPVDIGFECLGNAIGIRKYLNKNIQPICANFWFLPFVDSCVDSVFTYNGLDESRETEKTIKEVCRVLKSGGTFTVTSRKNAFMRQGSVLKQFGFTENEVEKLLRSCRVFTNTEDLQNLCEKWGFTMVSSKEFVINENLTEVVMQFKKGVSNGKQT